MNVLNIAYYTVLRNFRDRKELSLMLLLPIMLILILGTALGGVFQAGDIDATTICYLDEDNGFMAENFEKFLASEEIKELIEVRVVKSKEEAIEIIRKREATALIVLRSDFSKKVASNEQVDIEIYNSKYSNISTSIVQSMINGFVNGTNAQLTVRQMTMEAGEYKTYENIQDVALTTKGTAPRAIDYYAVTMLAMTIMYGTSYGNFALKEDRTLNTFIRLRTAPISYSKVVLGKLLGTIVTVFLQALVIICFTKFAYQVNWGGNLPFILFISFSLSLLSVGLGMMVSNLGKNPNATGALLNIMVNILTFVAGGYVPASQLSPIFSKLGYIAPNYLAQQAMFNTIYGGSAIETTNVMIAIWVIAAMAFIIAGLSGRRNVSW